MASGDSHGSGGIGSGCSGNPGPSSSHQDVGCSSQPGAQDVAAVAAAEEEEEEEEEEKYQHMVLLYGTGE
jgi:hypothetical protein